MTPTRYVIDTSILIQAMITEPNSPQVETLLAGLIVPDLSMQVWIPERPFEYCCLCAVPK